MFRPDCKASRVIFRTGSKKQPPMKGSPAIGTRLLNGLELKHQSRFGLDCLNDHSIAEDLSRLLVERTSRGVEAFNCTRLISSRAFTIFAAVWYARRPNRITRSSWADDVADLPPQHEHHLSSEYFRLGLFRGCVSLADSRVQPLFLQYAGLCRAGTARTVQP